MNTVRFFASAFMLLIPVLASANIMYIKNPDGLAITCYDYEGYGSFKNFDGMESKSNYDLFINKQAIQLVCNGYSVDIYAYERKDYYVLVQKADNEYGFTAHTYELTYANEVQLTPACVSATHCIVRHTWTPKYPCVFIKNSLDSGGVFDFSNVVKVTFFNPDKLHVVISQQLINPNRVLEISANGVTQSFKVHEQDKFTIRKTADGFFIDSNVKLSDAFAGFF